MEVEAAPAGERMHRLVLAPNPTSRKVQWTAPEGFQARTWRWSSPDGRTLASGTASDVRDLTWDLSDWTSVPGLYLCELVDASGVRWRGKVLFVP